MGLKGTQAWGSWPRVALISTLVSGAVFFGCHGESRTGQPAEVANRFFGSALRSDTASVVADLTRANRGRAGEVIARVTRNDSLQRVEWIRTDIWSEHGANVDVRRTFRGGHTDQLRLELKRESGDWRVAKAE